MKITDATAGALSTSGLTPAPEPLPSVYTIEALGNGRFRVPNVPFFAEHERDLGDGRKFKADVEWLSKAVDNMQRRSKSESFRAPLHLGHNDPKSTDERPSVGILENPRLRLALYEDKPTWVAFGDFILDSARDVEKLKKHRYRSVEIKNPNGEPKIDSIALLQSRTPYFKFPNLELAGAAAHYEEGPNGATGVFHFPTELRFADDPNTTAPPWAQQMLALLKQLASVFDPNSQPSPATQPVMQAEEPSEETMDAAKREKLAKKLAKIQQALAATPKPTGTMTYAEGAAIVERQKKLEKKQKKLTKKLAYEEPATPPAPAAAAPTTAPATPPAPVKYAESVLAFATKRASAAVEQKKIRDEVIQWAEKELADRPTGDATELRGLLEAQYAENGKAGVEGAVSVIKSMLPSLPGPHAHGDAGTKAPVGPQAELELRYADDETALEVIREMKPYWDARPAKYRDDSLESFVNADPRMDGRIRKAPGGSK